MYGLFQEYPNLWMNQMCGLDLPLDLVNTHGK